MGSTGIYEPPSELGEHHQHHVLLGDHPSVANKHALFHSEFLFQPGQDVSHSILVGDIEAFFQVEYADGVLQFSRVAEAIEKESLCDGKFLLRTNTDLPPADVVTSYKTLMGIERAFRQIKNFRYFI